MSKKSGLFVFLAGALIGSTASLLYAPRSGEETRKLLAENSQEIKDKVVNSIQEAQDSALTAIEESKAGIEALNKEAKERFAKLRDFEFTAEDEQTLSQEQDQPKTE